MSLDPLFAERRKFRQFRRCVHAVCHPRGARGWHPNNVAALGAPPGILAAAKVVPAVGARAISDSAAGVPQSPPDPSSGCSGNDEDEPVGHRDLTNCSKTAVALHLLHGAICEAECSPLEWHGPLPRDVHPLAPRSDADPPTVECHGQLPAAGGYADGRAPSVGPPPVVGIYAASHPNRRHRERRQDNHRKYQYRLHDINRDVSSCCDHYPRWSYSGR